MHVVDAEEISDHKMGICKINLCRRIDKKITFNENFFIDDLNNIDFDTIYYSRNNDDCYED